MDSVPLDRSALIGPPVALSPSAVQALGSASASKPGCCSGCCVSFRKFLIVAAAYLSPVALPFVLYVGIFTTLGGLRTHRGHEEIEVPVLMQAFQVAQTVLFVISMGITLFTQTKIGMFKLGFGFGGARGANSNANANESVRERERAHRQQVHKWFAWSFLLMLFALAYYVLVGLAVGAYCIGHQEQCGIAPPPPGPNPNPPHAAISFNADAHADNAPVSTHSHAHVARTVASHLANSSFPFKEHFEILRHLTEVGNGWHTERAVPATVLSLSDGPDGPTPPPPPPSLAEMCRDDDYYFSMPMCPLVNLFGQTFGMLAFVVLELVNFLYSLCSMILGPMSLVWLGRTMWAKVKEPEVMLTQQQTRYVHGGVLSVQSTGAAGVDREMLEAVAAESAAHDAAHAAELRAVAHV